MRVWHPEAFMWSGGAGKDRMLIISSSIAVISLMLASYEDIRTRSVTNAVWWIFSAGLLMLLFERRGVWVSYVPESILSVVIQEFIMSRAYGRADSHAFSCCAVFLCLTGSGLEGHILHMSLALVMLSGLQILRGNITRGLKLKRPVPFIPYIAVSFMISVIILHIVTPPVCW